MIDVVDYQTGGAEGGQMRNIRSRQDRGQSASACRDTGDPDNLLGVLMTNKNFTEAKSRCGDHSPA